MRKISDGRIVDEATLRFALAGVMTSPRDQGCPPCSAPAA